MKFFTQEWWEAGSENAEAVFERYESYLSSIRASLPPGLVKLEAEHTLHDAELKLLQSNASERTVLLVLNGWNRELQYKVRYVLKFTGVSFFEQKLPQQEYVESEFGDLGYWECELLQSEIEVRMLFVSSAEFRITFTGFTFEHARREASYLPNAQAIRCNSEVDQAGRNDAGETKGQEV
jgi:hypothetical protein